MEPKYKRIVLKFSGEALAGEKGFGLDPEVLMSIAQQTKEVNDLGVQVAVVVGGGNFWRGLPGSNRGMDRATADYMGMLATVINALALRTPLRRWGWRPGCKRPLRCGRLPNPISAGGPSAIWRKTGW